MGRTVDAYQWTLLFFKQCKYSWLLSKHYWCTIRSHCDKFLEESIELHYCFSRPFYGIDNTVLNLTTFDECGFYFTFLTDMYGCTPFHSQLLSYHYFHRHPWNILFQKFDMFLWTSGFQNPLVHTDFDMFVDE